MRFISTKYYDEEGTLHYNEEPTLEEQLTVIRSQYFFETQEPSWELEEIWLYISDIEKNYKLSVVILHGQRLLIELPYLKRMLYVFEPDQRPYTLRLIGKPSSGPSPPAKQTKIGILAA